MSANPNPASLINSTAGAVPVRNAKGEVTMEKVKVARYVTGRRPHYALSGSSEDYSDDDKFLKSKPLEPGEEDGEEHGNEEVDLLQAQHSKSDPRLRRLFAVEGNSFGVRRVEDPEVLVGDHCRRPRHGFDSEPEMEEVEPDEEEKARRRSLLRKVGLQKRDEELLAREGDDDDKEQDTSDVESDEEWTDSEEEEVCPRSKPVFVRREDRATFKDAEQEEIHYKRLEETNLLKQRQRRKDTLKILEEEMSKERIPIGASDDHSGAAAPKLTDVNTDDENEEAEYAAWKIRELKRVKRDREEKAKFLEEQAEIARLHEMTDEERRREMRLKPKVIVNKATKGNYKYLQKYYHRGAFFMDKEEEVFRKDFCQPTLEDHFDKSVLPKIMQVKNFGRSGQTKYTHLVDQDTTRFQAGWAIDSSQNMNFHRCHAAGVRQVFEKPTKYRTKKQDPEK